MCLISRDKYVFIDQIFETFNQPISETFFPILWFQTDVRISDRLQTFVKSTECLQLFHFQYHSLFQDTMVKIPFSSLFQYKNMQEVLDHCWFLTLNILLEKPSTQPCIDKPYGFSFSQPQACQQKFGPADKYCLCLRRYAFWFSLPFGSSSVSNFITTSHFVFTRYDTFNELQGAL